MMKLDINKTTCGGICYLGLFFQSFLNDQ